MKGIRFRTAHSPDIPTLHALIIDTITVCYAAFPIAYHQHWIKDHHSTDNIRTDSADGYTLVIEHQGNIIGTGNLLHDEIQRVFIHPDYQQQGLGTQLIKRLENHARQQAIHVIHVYALPPSRTFFERLGYQTISEYPFKDPSLRQFTYYVMEKRIE